MRARLLAIPSLGPLLSSIRVACFSALASCLSRSVARRSASKRSSAAETLCSRRRALSAVTVDNHQEPRAMAAPAIGK